MKYKFVESMDKTNDPNVDLNFDNDILYSGLLNTEERKEYDNGDIKPDTSIDKFSTDGLIFLGVVAIILIVGIILLLKYLPKKGDLSNKKELSLVNFVPDLDLD